ATATNRPIAPEIGQPEPNQPIASEAPASQSADGAPSGANAASPGIATSRPVYVEEGLASWYGPPYHNRRGSNGEIYDMHAMTAAHRTLPLNSLVRVTNLATRRSAVVRITDRGPFITGRVLDLSLAAAQAVDVWRAGVAKVRIEVLETPAPIDRGGRWCVQIGAFQSADEAAELKARLQRRYRQAQVLQFTGPTGEWLRVRVSDDDKRRAQALAAETKVDDGAVFLVRLD
ncbi:MAG TPA: septal ring lytic transglycosylase RlpA family protein, partial [Terriglobales bacterium]|nr:septal ring lytic transglycosylase RlpA family protein [Terriglobales bacterium]